MPERHLITRFNPDSRNPEFALVQVFSKKMPGISIDEQVPDEDDEYMGKLNLMVEEDHSDVIQTTWNRITDTYEFKYLQRACAGDTEFFDELEMSSNDVILPKDERSFMKFNRFLTRYAYHQAFERAQSQNNPDQVLELKLEFRKTWLPSLSPLQRRLAPHYIQSVVERLHNLVTTGEERKTFKDKVLDFIMG